MTYTTAKAECPLLPALLEGAEKTFVNAEQLFREAQILGEAGAFARALCLHQISLEECSKVDSLGAWATSLVLDQPVDRKKVLTALSRHSAKNKLNAYMIEPAEDELDARSRADWTGASEIFRRFQEAFHSESNRLKNGSLYVDWVEEAFVSPSERITPEMMVETRESNATFLGHALINLKALRRLVQDPDAVKPSMTALVDRMEALRDEAPADLHEQVTALLSAFIEQGVAGNAVAFTGPPSARGAE